MAPGTRGPWTLVSLAEFVELAEVPPVSRLFLDLGAMLTWARSNWWMVPRRREGQIPDKDAKRLEHLVTRVTAHDGEQVDVVDLTEDEVYMLVE